MGPARGAVARLAAPRELNTAIDHVEQQQFVASWSLRLHDAEKGNLPAELRWLRHLEDDDRTECLAELWDTLEFVHSDNNRDAFDAAIRDWRTTALALADANRREVLLGVVTAADFAPAVRPQ